MRKAFDSGVPGQSPGADQGQDRNQDQDQDRASAPGLSDSAGTRFEADDSVARVADFRAALLRFQHFCDATPEELGLSIRQYQTLLFVSNHPDDRGMTIGELGKALQVQAGTTTGLIERMEGKGLIERLFDTEHRRLVRLHLTPKGAAELARIVAEDIVQIEAIKLAAGKLAAS